MKSLPIKGVLELERINKQGQTVTRTWKFPGSRQTGDTFPTIAAYEANVLVSVVKVILDFFKEVE